MSHSDEHGKDSSATAVSLPSPSLSSAAPLPSASPPPMSGHQQRLLSLRLKMNAGRRENARSAKEEMERLEGKSQPTQRPAAAQHKQQQRRQQDEHTAERTEHSDRKVDPAIASLLHDAADTADSRWKDNKAKQRRAKGYASDDADEEWERKEGQTDESGRRRVRELSSHNVFDPQTAHRQYERSLLHAQQQQRIHQHKQHSAADSTAADDASSTSTSSSQPTADPYTGRATPSSTAVDRLVADMDAAAKRRAAFSRRRRFNDQEDVSYINERNRTFNKKVARSFDAYTIDIAQSLERGTAL